MITCKFKFIKISNFHYINCHFRGHLSYCKVSKIERYNELWRKYSFFCSCLACTGDLFPVINEQVVTREKLFKMATLVGKGIRTWNQETARKKYLCFIEMLQDFYTTLPTREVSNLHHWTFVCLAITNRPDFVF